MQSNAETYMDVKRTLSALDNMADDMDPYVNNELIHCLEENVIVVAPSMDEDDGNVYFNIHVINNVYQIN